MKFLLVSFICCIIFGKSLSNNVEEVDDFKILKGDYGVQDDETMRAFVHPAPKSLPFEKRSAFNALRSNPPFPILSHDETDFPLDEMDTNSKPRPDETNVPNPDEGPMRVDLDNVFQKKDKREALNDKSLVHTLNIQKNNKMNEEIKDTPENSKFHGAQFLDE